MLVFPTLRTDWLDQFKDQGFYCIGPVLDRDALARIRETYQKMFYTDDGTPLESVRDLSEQFGKPLRYLMLQRVNMHRDNQIFAKLVRHPTLLDMAEYIFSDDVRLYRDQGFFKPANDGDEVYMHQDNRYWHFDPPSAVTVWVALDDATVSNGCVYYIPGSHHNGEIPHVRAANGQSILLEACADRAAAIPVEVPAGHAIIHHCLTVHYTPANRSGQPRRAYTIQYVSASAKKRGESCDCFPVLRTRSGVLAS